MDISSILAQLDQLARPEALPGMARFGIRVDHALGVSMPELRRLASGIRKDYPRRDPAVHFLAGELWDTGVHEARILAALIDRPELVSAEQMERWAADFDSWDVVDQTCGSLFWQTSFAIEKALAWSARPEEYVKRAGFVLIAVLAVHAKKLPDPVLVEFLPVIEREAGDNRNYVRKAVNWALRQIGKRNAHLNEAAIACAERIAAQPSRTAHWIAADALRELCAPETQARLKGKI